MAFERLDDRGVHRMVTAQHHRHGPRCKDLPHRRLDVGVAAGHVGVHDIGIANVDHADLVFGQVGGVILEVVGAGMTEGEQGRCLANAAGSETCPRTPLGAHVVRRAEDCHIGVDRRPVGAHRGLGKRAMAHEGQVQAAGLVTVLCHVLVSPVLVLFQETGRLLDHRCDPLWQPCQRGKMRKCRYIHRPIRSICRWLNPAIPGIAAARYSWLACATRTMHGCSYQHWRCDTRPGGYGDPAARCRP
ncbi:hypothetical protein D3C75_811600 [compost metagenome]